MQKFSILRGYLDKQINLINRLYTEVCPINLSIYENRYVFALKTQQLYTAIEDLFLKIISKIYQLTTKSF